MGMPNVSYTASGCTLVRIWSPPDIAYRPTHIVSEKPERKLEGPAQPTSDSSTPDCAASLPGFQPRAPALTSLAASRCAPLYPAPIPLAAAFRIQLS